ncbi:MAG: helix-turn-helix transcriptional regulator [Pseudomonadota bacterium]|nr:helix-turn-helix transcriptional regulator [Pseudomonadota bacterium]MEC9368839.1 helix-turn-helix transcriptional regulator [Pseudomonadota bacterium]
MTPDQFRDWRKSLGLKQKDVAELLGLKKRVIQYYEKGKRDGKSVGIPRTVELACYALSAGIGGFDGGNVEPVPEEYARTIAEAGVVAGADEVTDDPVVIRVEDAEAAE